MVVAVAGSPGPVSLGETGRGPDPYTRAMTDGLSRWVPKPKSLGQWGAFVADPSATDTPARSLHDERHPESHVRVEHDNHTLMIHIRDRDSNWTTVALDRASQEWALTQRESKGQAAEAAYRSLYNDPKRFQPFLKWRPTRDFDVLDDRPTIAR